MHKLMIVLVVVVLASPLLFRLILATILVPVDRTEYVYVTEFGKHIATYDGARQEDAGLHWRWPWPVQSVLNLDRRLQYFDLPGAELLTHDPRGNTIDRTLTIMAYVCWRITNEDEGVDWFVRRVGTPDQARTILGQRISSQLGAAISKMELDDLISIQPGKVDTNVRQLRDRLLTNLQPQAKKDYGIDLVDIRLRRHSYPAAVRPAIFERIQSERNKKVAEYRSQGDQLAAHIKSEAERDARNIVTEARARELELKGQADAEAYRLLNTAHSKDVQFYAFLKKLEGYQRILGDNKTVLLLSAHRDLFDLLFNPPRLDGRPPSPQPLSPGGRGVGVRGPTPALPRAPSSTGGR